MPSKILLIAISVSISDIRTAMALQKLKEDDYLIINNEEDALLALEFQGGERNLLKREEEKLFAVLKSIDSISIPVTKEFKRRKDTYKPRFNVSSRDVVRFRSHPQMARRG